MEVPTLELRPLKGENGSPTTDDGSSSPYRKIPTPLPPYSDMDHDFVSPECNGFSNSGNVIDTDNNCRGGTIDRSTQDISWVLFLLACGKAHDSGDLAMGTYVIKWDEGTTPALSAFYAKVMIFVAAILVFLEVVPGPVPLLFFQGYVFTYLLCGSIAIFIIIYIVILKRICPRFIYVEYDTNHKETPVEQSLVYSNISIFLRIAVAVFGLVTLISDGLEIASLYSASSNCMNGSNFAEVILRELFNLLQIHFLLISAKEIIHAPRFLRYVALMHLLATNLSICIRLLIWESAKDWLDSTHVKHNSSTIWPPKDFSITYHSVESDLKSTNVSKHYPRHNVHFTTNCYWRDSEEENNEDLISLNLCLQNSTTGAVWEQAMPYLYSFKIQYSLVAAAIIYLMWSNLQASHLKIREMAKISVHVKGQCNQRMNYGDSIKGLISGSVVMVVSIITIIIFFVAAEDKVFIITIFHTVIFLVTIVAAVLGTVKIKTMKSRIKQHYHVMEVLQEIEKFAVYCLGICNMVAGGISFSKAQHVLLFVDGILTMVQAFLQSLFIHQVSKKKLGSSHMDKPGKQVVIFLILSNLGLWFFESFTTQNLESTVLQRQLFGNTVWPLILRLIMPLVIFYRFHSAVLLAEAWRKLYKIKSY